LRAGWGLIIEMGYLLKKYEYDFSTYNMDRQKQLQSQQNSYKTALSTFLDNPTRENKLKQYQAYNRYLNTVNEILNDIKKNEKGGI
jgi:hypothetical protein